MSGFVRGGPREVQDGDEQRTAIVAREWDREIVEVTDSDPRVLHLVEPVVVGEAGGDDGEVDPVLVEADLGVRVAQLVGGRVPDAQLPPRSYRHEQIGAATLWQIQHGLGFRPHFEVRDRNGVRVSYERAEHPTLMITELHFGVPVAGSADGS